MAWAEFSGAFDWTVPEENRVTVAFLPGMRCPVRQDCLEAAVAHGAARPMRAPRRDVATRLKADPYWRGDAERA